MLEFDQPFKLYVFKDSNRVSWSLRVSENHVHSYNLARDEFELMLRHWQQPGGYHWQSNSWRWFVEHKTQGPAPQHVPANYVKIFVGGAGQDFHYRFELTDMIDLEREFFYQCNNQMHWDS